MADLNPSLVEEGECQRAEGPITGAQLCQHRPSFQRGWTLDAVQFLQSVL